MYWHIDTDIISLIVLIAVYIYLLRALPQQRSNPRSRWFRLCFLFGIVITVIDIAASVVMEVPVSFVVYHIAMSLYFITLENVILSWIYYSLSILYYDDDKRRRFVAVMVAVPYMLYVPLVCSNPWTGLIFSLGENNAYSRGPLFFIMLVLYILYAVTLFALIVIRRKHIPPGYSLHILAMTPLILGIAVAVQLMCPGWLVILPGYMICLVLAFLFLEKRQVQDSHQLVQSLSKAASTDPLTGLCNRAGMETALRLSAAEDEGKTCVVILADIDALKSINDTLGHGEGDRAIRMVGKQLQAHFRASDMVSRYGGDEFLIYLTGDMTELQMHRSMQRLIDEIARLRIGAQNDIPVSVSLGLSMGLIGSVEFDLLCTQADAALYSVKRHGKRGYAFYQPEMINTPIPVRKPEVVE